MRSLGSTCARLCLALAALVLAQHAHSQDKKPEEKKLPDIPAIDKADEQYLRRANLETDGPALVQFFKKRTLPEKDRPELERHVRMLGSYDYRVREQAMNALLKRGVAALDVLRTAHVPFDPEAIRRVERSIESIHDQDVGAEVPPAAVRVLAFRKPAELVETLLAYVPFADNDAVVDEIRIALGKSALDKDKPAILAALTDRAPSRRALGAEVLARAAFAEHRLALRKLLTDGDATVRSRVAQALAFGKERDAIPILIDTLPDLPAGAAWQAEDFLLQLARDGSAPSAPLGNDRQTRDKCKAAWQEWWKKHETKVDLAKLEQTPRMLGRTLIVLLDQGSVLELGPDGNPRWQLKNIVFPLDAQMVGDDRVLIAEYHASKVSERDVKTGEIVWQKQVPAPLAAQRLANGNTFVLTDRALLEYDKDGRETMNISFDGETRKIMKAMKLENGETVCMQADSRIVRYDPQGREVGAFEIPLGTRLFGGRIHMMPSGRVLVPHASENKVTEYDHKGKVVWEIPFAQPIAATRMPNGHTLITSMDPGIGAVEVDRTGREVWSYRHESNTRVTRAIRR